MRQEQMMGGRHREGIIFQTRRVDSRPVAHPSHHGRFVVRDPVLDPVAECTRNDIGVIHERFRRGTDCPAPLVFQCLRQVPVIERYERLDARFEQTIHQFAVEIKTFLINLTASGGQDAGPRDRKAIGLQADLLHQADVFFPAVVVVIRHLRSGRKPLPCPR